MIGRRWIFGLGLMIAALIVLCYGVAVMMQPWIWTPDQVLLSIACACLVVVGALWGLFWFRHGMPATKLRWKAKREAMLHPPLEDRNFVRAVVIWVAVLMGVAILFTMSER